MYVTGSPVESYEPDNSGTIRLRTELRPRVVRKPPGGGVLPTRSEATAGVGSHPRLNGRGLAHSGGGFDSRACLARSAKYSMRPTANVRSVPQKNSHPTYPSAPDRVGS